MPEHHQRKQTPVSFAEYVIIIAVMSVIVIGVLVLLGPAIAHLLAQLVPHLFI